MSSTTSKPAPEVAPSDDQLSIDELLRFDYEKALINQSAYLFDFYHHIEMPLLSIGLFGHCLSLLTLFRSSNMQTPSFAYHKMLTIAELAYVLNCFVQKFLDVAHEVDDVEQGYDDVTAAWYSAVVNRIVGSVTGYVVLYMTLAIAFDRFFALHCHGPYRAWINTRKAAYTAIAISFFLSTFVNSWTSPFENVVRCANVSCTIFQITAQKFSPPIQTLKDGKDLCNSILRIGYPIVLTIVTAFVILSFARQRRKRNLLRQGARINARQRMPAQQSVSANPITRKQKSLFYLLLAVVILAYIQVIPREMRRILDLLYPYPRLVQDVDDVEIGLDERFRLLRIMYYGHIWGKLLANLCTFINRSLTFYLYFSLNRAFRLEVVLVLRGLLSAVGNVRKAQTSADSG